MDRPSSARTGASPRFSLSALQLSLRAGLGAGAAMAIAQALELAYPVYAMLAAVIVTDLSAAQTRELGVRRLAATVVGASTGALLGPALPQGPWSVALGIVLAMVACQLAGAGKGARVAGYIAGIVILGHAEENWSYAWLRFVETALGVGVAWLISLVPRLVRPEEDPGSC